MAVPFTETDLNNFCDSQMHDVTVEVGLYTANPHPSVGASDEAAGPGYGRQTVEFDVASGAAGVNTNVETWTGLTPAQMITHAARFVGGVYKGSVALANPQYVNSDGEVTLAAGALSFGFNITDPEA